MLTALLTWSLLFYPGVTSPFVRPVLAAAYVGWLLFVAAEPRRPRVARIALAAAALLPAAVTALPNNGSTLLFLYGTLFTFVLLPRMPLWAILSLTAAIIAVLLVGLRLAGHGPTAMLTQPALILILLLFNLHRREYRLRTDESLRTQEALARAAALDERARIARELHDVLAHSLGALGVQLEVAEAQLTSPLGGDVEAAAERVRRARKLAAEGLVEARSAVAALRADVRPLPQALADLAAGHRTDHGTAVTLRIGDGRRALPSGAEVSLLRTAREALTNAARHAPGAAVAITLDYLVDRVRLTVENPAAPPAGTGYGLIGARERLALVGGTLDAGVTGGVWRVTAEVPG